MKPVPLPYLVRPDIEQRLADFLRACLQPAPNIPKALIVHGPPGVGKRTLLRHVYTTDACFKQYKITDPDTREALEGKAPARRKQFLEKTAEVPGQVAGLAQPLVGFLRMGCKLAIYWRHAVSSPVDDSGVCTDSRFRLAMFGRSTHKPKRS